MRDAPDFQLRQHRSAFHRQKLHDVDSHSEGVVDACSEKEKKRRCLSQNKDAITYLYAADFASCKCLISSPRACALQSPIKVCRQSWIYNENRVSPSHINRSKRKAEKATYDRECILKLLALLGRPRTGVPPCKTEITRSTISTY